MVKKLNRFNQESKYERSETVSLNSNEQVAILNTETGELTTLSSKSKRGRPKGTLKKEGKEVWLPEATFVKHYPQSWKWLREHTTDNEFKAAYALAQLAKAYTNSLEPLNDATIIPDLVAATGVSKNLINVTLHKLWKLGVYAKFEVYDPSKPYTKYWILNPYLSFNGKLIDSGIAKLFSGTYVALAYKKIPFTLNEK